MIEPITIPSDIEGLIFDLDGTLADSMPVHEAAWETAFGELGLSYPADYIPTLNGSSTRSIVQLVNERFTLNLDVTAFSLRKDELAYAMLHKVVPIEPVLSVARAHRGLLPMAVASGGLRKNVEATLAAIGLSEFFQPILTADDPFDPKPSPALFLEASRIMNVAPTRCLVLEDGDFGIEAAARAGMRWIDVRRHYETKNG